MLIDTHLHEKKYSSDSFISLTEIVERAILLGLDGVCITDHESNEIREEAAELSRKTGFLIITGAEILTREGDMTVFGLAELPTTMVSGAELVQQVARAGGVAVCAHPYRKNNRGMGDSITDLPHVWGIEAFNGSTPEEYNLQAFELSAALNTAALGASDAHVIEQVGKFATWMPDWVKDEASFIQAVQRGMTMPAAWDNGYRIIDRSLLAQAVSF